MPFPVGNKEPHASECLSVPRRLAGDSPVLDGQAIHRAEAWHGRVGDGQDGVGEVEGGRKPAEKGEDPGQPGSASQDLTPHSMRSGSKGSGFPELSELKSISPPDASVSCTPLQSTPGALSHGQQFWTRRLMFTYAYSSGVDAHAPHLARDSPVRGVPQEWDAEDPNLTKTSHGLTQAVWPPTRCVPPSGDVSVERLVAHGSSTNRPNLLHAKAQ